MTTCWLSKTLLFLLLSLFLSSIVFYYLLVSKLSFHSSISSKDVVETTSNPINATPEVIENLFYAHNPHDFIHRVSDCMMDRNCLILYWHTQKTGGSYLASKLYGKLNAEPYRSKEWCCNENFMKQKFQPATYCNKQMGVYEVKPKQFQYVLQQCSKYQYQYRYLGLATIREPLQRTLSGIHQRCNVHSSRLDENTKRVCTKCQYDQDDPDTINIFGKVVNDTNNVYVGLKDLLLNNSKLHIPLLVLDTIHITNFLNGLEGLVTDKLHSVGVLPKNQSFLFPQGTANAEKKKKICDFGMHSLMMRQHGPSLDAYHWLWAGFYDYDRAV